MTEIARTQPGDCIGLYDGLIRAAVFGFGVNEISLRSLIPDPPKFALEFVAGGSGAWCVRYVLPNGSPVEIALIQFKKDERTRGRDDVIWGEWTIHMKGPARWVGQDASGKEDDGMRLVFLATHDYVWQIGQPGPFVPPVTLPPPSAPDTPPDDWLTPDSQAKHRAEIVRIVEELAPMPLDEGRVRAYLEGRNRNLAEVHDDELTRAALEHDPCEGANRIPLP